MRGQTVCRVHGGRAKQSLAAGAERFAKEQAVRETDRAMRRVATRALGEPIFDRDPAEVIAEQIAWRTGRVKWLRDRVRALDPASLGWGRTREKIGGEDGGLTREARPNVWYLMLIEAERDLEKLCLDAIRAGLEERRVRIAEEHGAVIVKMLGGLLAELGHSLEDPATAAVVERHLRLVGE